ncbi:MAG: lipocalin-like domain-containing protein [Bacteroidaceae bacterium]|nr:lipocalin-like domain-containing protein [Bacteroidaceae bacterium]
MRNVVLLMLLSCILCSCDKMFPNDRLDYMWRLDGIEYTSGYDLDGNECDYAAADYCWMSLARHLSTFEGMTYEGYSQTFGQFVERQDSIFFDFSMFPDTTLTMAVIRNFGMESMRPHFSYRLPHRNRLVLKGDSTVLYFSKW